MKRILLFLRICLLLTAPRVFAQTTAQEIQTLLETEAVTYAQAAGFIVRAAAEKNLPPDDAFKYAADNAWVPKSASAEKPASLEGVSLMLMKAFNYKGGLMYMLTASPHSAYREMVYLNVIQGRSDPSMNVSGEVLLFLTNRILAHIETESQE